MCVTDYDHGQKAINRSNMGTAPDGSSTYFAFAIQARYRTTFCLTLLNAAIVFFEDT